MLKPINPKKLKKLEYILENVWNGTFDHNQMHFFCKTSKCIAGWAVCLYSQPEEITLENVSNYNDFKVFENNKIMFRTEKSYDPWDWSREYFELTEGESTLLFSGAATKPIPKLTLNALKEGRRLYCNYLFNFSRTWGDYETLCPLIVYSDEVQEKLLTFFNTTEKVVILK
jgi:hypothetical protein